MRVEMSSRGVRRRRVASVLAALCFALALASCAPESDTVSGPSSTPAPTAMPVGTDDEPPLLTQDAVAAPTTADGALAAADRIANDDQVVFFEFYQGRASWESFAEFEAGKQLELMKTFVSQSDGGVLGGEPTVWLSDYSASAVSPLEVGGVDYPFGVVHLRGCYESRGDLTYPDSQGDPPPTTVGLYFPTDLTVEYEPVRQLWLITDSVSLTDFVGQAECRVSPA